MSIRRRTQVVQQQIRRWVDPLFTGVWRSLQAFIAHLLRGLFFIGISRRRPDRAISGFILPTTVLLLLVVSLAVGSISLRTYSRTKETIGQRQQQVIYNAATPAIDRAKAKIAYLLERHKRTTSGVPPEGDLLKMMLNTDASFSDNALDANGDPITDIYTFDRDLNGLLLPEDEREQRLDLNDDGALDNAWAFKVDTNSDGTNDAWLAYSIIFSTPEQNTVNQISDDNGQAILKELKDGTPPAIKHRAEALEVRNAPKSLLGSSPRCPAAQEAGVEGGWFSDAISTTFLRKNFQVNALVIPGRVDEDGTLVPDPNATVETLEMQQDRTFDLGNKWGAWFQNDLEIFPGKPLKWNGAMRTQGSLIVGLNQLEAFLISSRYSCFNLEAAASEIRVGQNVVSGRVDNKDAAIIANVHLFKGFQSPDTPDEKKLGKGEDAEGTVRATGEQIADYQEISDIILLDPVKIFLGLAPDTRGDVADNAAELGWTDPINNPNGWNTTSALKDRITVQPPSGAAQVDYGDTYRADDRLTTNANGDDGEWEKNAHQQGMRVIVGQRLELGIPLEVWDGSTCQISGNALAKQNKDRCHEARQRRTLKDNLAAVQATAIYHADVTKQPAVSDGNTPLACLATTVHPGTSTTLQRSATFHNVNADLNDFIKDSSGAAMLAVEDFFSGYGTNGWEFEPPISNPRLDDALSNLANFAGDPKGGAPSFAPIQDDVVHPYPEMARWGDFSILRQALKPGGATSIADQSTVATASCMVGMLAHNISYLNNFDLVALVSGTPEYNLVQNLATELNNLSPAPTSPEAAVSALDNAGIADEMVYVARLIMTKEQVKRDRAYGFEKDVGKSACENDPGILAFTGLENLCADQPKYPALYSIFPGDTSNDGTINANDPGLVDGDNHKEDIDNERARGFDPTTSDPDHDPSSYILSDDVNADVKYVAFTDDDIEEIALKPREMDDWVLPHDAVTLTGAAAAAAPNSMGNVLIKCDGTTSGWCDSEHISVGFKDAAIMDGRQLMNVRVLDLNLKLLKTERSDKFSNDTWLATDHSALVYGFREDAVREDAIVRPVDPARNGPCDNDAAVQLEACWMNAGAVTAFASTDPPLVNGTSIKPVDYWTDPDRRPYGFRLRHGADLARGSTAGVDESFSFISDNPVYIMGNFNEHKNSDGDEIQEFQDPDLLPANYDNDAFYDREKVDTAFGTTTGDQWRPAEVLSEAVSILSNNFCDGSIEDLFDFSDDNSLSDLETKYGCKSDVKFTSYTNYTDLQATLGARLRAIQGDEGSPVQISKNGNPCKANVNDKCVSEPDEVPPYNHEYKGAYDSLATGRDNHIIEAAETTTNVSIYSGIVPSRINQSYGGLHNFPRLLENWKIDNNTSHALNISGAFFQLGFSTSSTAPYDQKHEGKDEDSSADRDKVTWEPNAASIAIIKGEDNGASHEYYNPPQRNWGYDVALQKNAPGAVASKFISQTPLVSEFYNSLEVNDPYIHQLCIGLDDAFTDADFNCIEPD